MIACIPRCGQLAKIPKCFDSDKLGATLWFCSFGSLLERNVTKKYKKQVPLGRFGSG